MNPNDPRYTWLKGKKVIVPLVGRAVPIIMDEYVEMDFGTGCLKVTPAHDVNDYMLGDKYNLPQLTYSMTTAQYPKPVECMSAWTVSMSENRS